MFNRDLIVKQLPGYKWEVNKKFLSVTNFFEVEVPKGFKTDLGSVPRPLWWWISPAGRHSQACVVHDYMYENALYTKEKADKGFLENLLWLGVPTWKAYMMYNAVKYFGKGKYK